MEGGVLQGTIHKYELSPGVTSIQVPKGTKILDVQAQFEIPCVWVLKPVNLSLEHETLIIETHATGVFIGDTSKLKYLATFQLEKGALVFHAFLRKGN